MRRTVLLLFGLVAMNTGLSLNIGNTKESICEKISIPMCQGIGYEYTLFPNMFNHRTQSEASLEIRHYVPLVDWVCYKWLPKFLCSMYAPMCTNTSVIIPPCRSLCQRSMQGCLPLMKSFGDKWPEKFNCSNFPEEGGDKMCFADDSRISEGEKKCRTDQFQCTNYDKDHEMCIPKNWKCDGMKDCMDASDETFCPPRATTKPKLRIKGPITTVTPLNSCQRISRSLRNRCSKLGYAYTRLPNRFGHTNQDQISRALEAWDEAIRKQCSPLLEDFLCRVHVPSCDNHQAQIPCRSMCKKVKKSCRRFLKRLKIKWPSSLRCGKLHKKKCYGAVHKSSSRSSTKKIKITKKIKPTKKTKPTKKGSCEKIIVPMCQGIGYNNTKLPNIFNHRSQAEVDIEVYQYLPLIEIRCSPFLRMFLCSMYVPICNKANIPIPPCRSLCETSKEGCEPLMRKYGFGWPTKFSCQKFPKFGDKICMI